MDIKTDMIMAYRLLLSICVTVICMMLGSCADDDPKIIDDYPQIGEIASPAAWGTVEATICGSNGKIFDVDKDLIYEGVQVSLIFSIKNTVIDEYISNYQHFTMYTCYRHAFHYDQCKGDMYKLDSKSKSKELLFSIVSYDPCIPQLVVKARFGELVCKGMLKDNYDPYSPDFDFSPDEESYALLKLRPVTDNQVLERINKAYIKDLSK